eukprot:TRINITY_DN10268_c0_g1_i1.p2 TRINITY_DN10268_c0_g1~~TRINITY_DN10268_c0_g1_i1.p2  ORF type:complete len:117 (-),score=11.99 TRINITY_DN10268_c0_g1_i1:704-1054(-)
MIWDTRTPKCCGVLSGHQHYLTTAALLPGSTDLILSASEDRTLKAWDLRLLKVIDSVNVSILDSDNKKGYVKAILPITKRGQHPPRLVTGSADASVMMWKYSYFLQPVPSDEGLTQ